jgi:adenine-specific DNA-methyltransferase
MRYIGSKKNLLKEIESVIKPFKKFNSFCDLFSGTAIVAQHFKKDFKVISNDLLYFSYVFQKAVIENNGEPKFNKFIKEFGKDPLTYFSEIDEKKFKLLDIPFIHDNYSPTKKCDRKYLSNENALLIDIYRQLINLWKKQGLINDNEYFYLIAVVVQSVPYVSNIAGTYGAFLKQWDHRSLNRITLRKFDITSNDKDNKSYNEDSNELIRKISGDILYIDPPYNHRQYSSNYHLLETIARYDRPEVKGVTGVRKDKSLFSRFSSIPKVHEAFSDLIENADFKVIVVSYSNEGLMKEDEITDILHKHGKKSSFKIKTIPYRRYKRTNEDIKHNLNELLFTIQK